ncbi:DUF5615 family PIN-like protein [Candidatus Poribacteria bacterium]
MKFKLDENLGIRTRKLFRTAGHEARTVRDQGMQGCSDQHLYEVCSSERHCLITLDLDFADVIRFPPTKTGGIVVIRLPRNPSFAVLEELVHLFLQTLGEMSVESKLWIVEPRRIRVHQSEIDQ